VDEHKPRKRRGAGRVTLNTVARQAGVSAITVSRYFNQPEQVSPERRERIAEVVAQLGYVPNLVAGGLASARGKIVAMVIPNISGPILPIRCRASATPSVVTATSCCWPPAISASSRRKARCALFSVGRRQRWC